MQQATDEQTLPLRRSAMAVHRRWLQVEGQVRVIGNSPDCKSVERGPVTHAYRPAVASR
jgi:hypothetical protein